MDSRAAIYFNYLSLAAKINLIYIQSKLPTQIKKRSAILTTQKLEAANQYANYILSIFDHFEANKQKLAFVCTKIGEDKELANMIVEAIKASDYPQSKKDAAEILFQLHLKTKSQTEGKQARSDFIAAIKDPRLTLEYANLIYLMNPEHSFYHNLVKLQPGRVVGIGAEGQVAQARGLGKSGWNLR